MGRRGTAQPPPSFPKTSSPSPGKGSDLGKLRYKPGWGTKGAVRPGCSYRGGGRQVRTWALQVTVSESCVTGIRSQSLSRREAVLLNIGKVAAQPALIDIQLCSHGYMEVCSRRRCRPVV